MNAQSHRRHLLFAFVFVGVLFVMLEAVLLALGPTLTRRFDLDTQRVARILAAQTEGIEALLSDERTRTVLDTTLGWRYREGFNSAADRINSRGLRSAREFSPRAAAGVRRVAAFGDSFVYGNEVADADTWTAVLERELADVEVLNYGVGGYGTDQAYLRYLREGVEYAPDIVLIGFAPVNLRRAINVYPRFISSADEPVVKPRFKLIDSDLHLIPNPLPDRADWERLTREPRRVTELGTYDEWYDALRYENPLYDRSVSVRFAIALGLKIWRKYLWSGRLLARKEFRPEAPAFALQLALLSTFADSVRARGARPVVVLFPDRWSIEQVFAAQGSAAAGPGPRAVYAPLKDSLVTAGRVEVFDLMDAFAASGTPEDVPSWFAPGLHYSAAGNALIARWLGERLRKVY